MNRTSILLAFALAAGCARSPLDTGSGGAGGDTASPPGECGSGADCDPAIDACYVGACSIFNRCIIKPSCLDPAPECPINDCDPAAGEVEGKEACDDGEAHTADRCVDAGNGCGVCAHVRVECDGFDDDVVQATVCDDGEPCSTDRCLVSACVHKPIANCTDD